MIIKNIFDDKGPDYNGLPDEDFLEVLEKSEEVVECVVDCICDILDIIFR